MQLPDSLNIAPSKRKTNLDAPQVPGHAVRCAKSRLFVGAELEGKSASEGGQSLHRGWVSPANTAGRWRLQPVEQASFYQSKKQQCPNGKKTQQTNKNGGKTNGNYMLIELWFSKNLL